MELYNKLEKELNIINKRFLLLKKEDIKKITNIIKNENRDLSSNIKLINNNDNVDILIDRIIKTSNVVIDKTYLIIEELNKEVSKIIIHLFKGVDNVSLNKLELIYQEEVKKIDNLNEKFIKTMIHNYDLVSKNKNEMEIVLLEESRNKMISYISKIILSKKLAIKETFKYNYIPFVKYLKTYKKSDKNSIVIYFDNLYSDYYKNSLNKHKELISNNVNDMLNEMKEKINKINKLKNNKEFKILKDYLDKFINDLYIKNDKVLLGMKDILNNKDKEKNYKECSNEIEKIYNIDYCFDKIFDSYKISNQNILLSNRAYDKVSNVINDYKEKIEKEIKSNMISLYKDNSEYLNTLIYKIMICEVKK